MRQSQHVSSLGSRLDAIPLCSRHYRIWAIAATGFLFEGLDLTIIGGILVVLTKDFHIGPGIAGLLGTAALAGYVIGVAVAGWVGDRFGRKFVMQYTLLMFAGLTLITAASWNAESYGVLRFLTGIGIGGESAIVTPYLAELMPANSRGRFMGIADALFTVGAILASLITLALVPSSSAGWRWSLVVAAIPAIYVWVIRRHLPESPRWLATHDRLSEANQIVGTLEEAAGIPASEPASTDQSTPAVDDRNRRNTIGQLWSRGIASRTSLLWVTWFFTELVYYGFLTWIPSFLVKQGFTVTKSLEYSFVINIAALVGGVAASFLQDTRIGRKASIVLLFLLSALSAYLFSISTSKEAIIAAAAALSFLLNGLFSVLYSFTPEQYPTALRSTGQGFASAFGHIGGAVGPAMVGFVLVLVGINGVFGLFAIFLIVPILAVTPLRETRAQQVDQLGDAVHLTTPRAKRPTRSPSDI